MQQSEPVVEETTIHTENQEEGHIHSNEDPILEGGQNGLSPSWKRVYPKQYGQLEWQKVNGSARTPKPTEGSQVVVRNSFTSLKRE